VQMVCENGAPEANLNGATRLVEEAAHKGARLIALPELFSGGYWLCEKAWDTAEPLNGLTETWLRQTAKRLGVYLGGSYLLADGEDFLDVFALATPAGEIAGRVPKQKPGSVESFLFRGKESPHIIETELGRIGVGICYDNAFRFLADAMIAGDADLLIMSFSAPTPQQTWYYRKASTDAFRASYRHGASNMARLLGIPAIQVNKCGAWKSELPTPFPAQDSKFDGQSEIADGSGEIVAELADQEAALVADVVLDPSRKKRALPVEATRYGRWIAPVPADFRLFWIVELFGRRSYERSRRRRERARAIGNRLPQTSQAAT
jgi:N-carbamoylputrescine amidase